MIFVFTPIYDYDESREVYEFESIEKAISFVEEDLRKNKTASFHNGSEDYIVVEGRKIKLKAIEYASKVVVD
jgi:hypothetical protein